MRWTPDTPDGVARQGYPRTRGIAAGGSERERIGAPDRPGRQRATWPFTVMRRLARALERDQVDLR
jgi:hypothetical protein